MFSSMVKSCKFIVKTMVFEGLAGCVRECKRCQKTSKMITSSIPKSIKNQCRTYARKGDAQVMENEWKMNAKLEPKSIKIIETRLNKRCDKKRRTGRGSASRARAPFLDSNISSSSLKHLLNVLTSIRFAC